MDNWCGSRSCYTFSYFKKIKNNLKMDHGPTFEVGRWGGEPFWYPFWDPFGTPFGSPFGTKRGPKRVPKMTWFELKLDLNHPK